MLWVKFVKQMTKLKTLSLLVSGEQTPAALHNQKIWNQQNTLLAMLVRLAFRTIEGKFLLFFGHMSGTAHVSRVNKIWLTEKLL